ncbi:prepilin-type N-terminal cleavage/methylation domain-containing protein, partial [Pontibacterium sp.]
MSASRMQHRTLKGFTLFELLLTLLLISLTVS